MDGKPIIPIEKTNSILSSLSMKCSSEVEYAKEFVEVIPCRVRAEGAFLALAL